MTVSSHSFDADYRRRGMFRQIVLSLFVGVPATVGLAFALAAYCTFEYAAFLFRGKSQTLNLSRSHSEKSFTTSLANMAEIHAPTPKIDSPSSDIPAEVDVTEQQNSSR